ncbi:NAD-dependent succinate-semialdehyde dehydrogenase [Pontibacillus halophilus]|uniref:NAD-dependent succinate-semialdehyde dehydrogenase n=1 Tax=Pontibacillus halophilus TaxID=516704 RepID=UPI00041447D0|nr:NAD-dependent succinate-semialdehyde dehydrogenase [Pontibacillus halophilus]
MNIETKNQMYINGEWVNADSGETTPVTNPATGEEVARVPNGGQAETKRAVEAAKKAYKSWSKLTASERGQHLRKLFNLVNEHAEHLGRVMTLEQGKPVEEATGEVQWGAGYLEFYSEEAKRLDGELLTPSSPSQRIMVQKHPIGVVGAITPWNFPSSLLTRKIAQALSVGCTLVLKPAPETPLSAIALFELIEKAELPAGVVNLVMGDAQEIGDEFLTNKDVRKLSFTGSTNVGKYLMEQSGQQLKKLSMELGGHAPFIVFEDADLDRAVDGLLANKSQNGGQTCICANRIFVHEDIKDAFIDKFTEKYRNLNIGNGFHEGIQVGPLIRRDAIDKVNNHIEDAVSQGATLVTGGEALTEGDFAKGNFFMPTVLKDVTPSMKIFREETFGPVAPFITFSSDDEVIQLANDSDYGLAGYFYTKDLARAMEVSSELEYGMVGINASAMGDVNAPFGGMKESGMGREGGHHGIEDYVEYKYINLQY